MKERKGKWRLLTFLMLELVTKASRPQRPGTHILAKWGSKITVENRSKIFKTFIPTTVVSCAKQRMS